MVSWRASVSGVFNFSSVETIDAKFDPNDFITGALF